MLTAVRTGVVLVVPELDNAVDPWRRRTVPMAVLGVPVHVTVLFPWVASPVSAADVARLRSALGGVPPLELTFNTVSSFPQGVVHLVPTPAAAVEAVVHRVAGAFPEHPPYEGEHADVQPHLTVALCAPQELTATVRAVRAHLVPVLPRTVVVREVTVLSEQPDGRWVSSHRIGLQA